ncbi:hypothetical protein ACOCEA_01930 [Maribacter sp. CXY002]|uniref:hypothetical protein n=1 Tax=Maribacter luteocoastalis TaxID=3407671 RepID=UPI003B683496
MKLSQIACTVFLLVSVLSCKDTSLNTKDSSSPKIDKTKTPEYIDSTDLRNLPPKKQVPKTKGLDTLKPKIAAL